MIARFMLVSDDNYVNNLGVCTYSIMHNNCPNVDKLVIYVMNCGISEENKAKLVKQAERFDNAEMFFYDINAFLDSVMPKVKTHWNRSIYGRLFLKELAEQYPDIDRIVYLDCDIIVDQPLTELFEMDMKGKCLAGVRDCDEIPRKKELKMSEDDIYINSGTLVIDVKRWVELDAGNRIIDYINSYSNKFNYPDQDAINIVLCGEITTLPLEYNMMWMICDRDIPKIKKELDTEYTAEEIHYALHNAKIIHFARHDMWSMYGNTSIPTRAFKKYKKLSDWKHCRRKFHSIKEFIIWSGVVVKRKLYRD